ncbi:thymidylate synthase [uncultured Lentibacter sp.]|uniref:thymidylate synthase n=1 Tax=uncultured Lentibacter sp. TaxID=1659309 RepID=UPI0026300C0B|nr:thymidylate synthase [uncultured Lentibacter sp.]
MKYLLSAMGALSLLAACSGDGTNPFTQPGTTTPNATPVPALLAGDVSAVAYDASAQTLTVTGVPLISGQQTTQFTRNAALDVAGYEAYSVQDDALSRHVIALVSQSSNSGALRAGVVSTGGQFGQLRNGGYYERSGAYTPPATGLVRYAGTYAGLTNISISGDLLPTDPNTPTAILPGQSARTEGDILITVDFSSNVLEGSIYNREIVDTGTGLPTLMLVSTPIGEDGTFYGTDISYQGDSESDVGDYGGLFGGPNAEALGGIVDLSEFDNDLLGLENETELGVFVLDSCDSAAGSHPTCTP